MIALIVPTVRSTAAGRRSRDSPQRTSSSIPRAIAGGSQRAAGVGDSTSGGQSPAGRLRAIRSCSSEQQGGESGRTQTVGADPVHQKPQNQGRRQLQQRLAGAGAKPSGPGDQVGHRRQVGPNSPVSSRPPAAPRGESGFAATARRGSSEHLRGTARFGDQLVQDSQRPEALGLGAQPGQQCRERGTQTGADEAFRLVELPRRARQQIGRHEAMQALEQTPGHWTTSTSAAGNRWEWSGETEPSGPKTIVSSPPTLSIGLSVHSSTKVHCHLAADVGT